MPPPSQRKKEKLKNDKDKKENKEDKEGKLSSGKREAPTSASQRTVSKFVRRDEQSETEKEVENGLDKIAMDLSLEMEKAATNPSPLAIEVMSIFPMMLPMIVDRIMPQVMERITEQFEKKIILKLEKKTDDMLEKYENIRAVDNLRTAVELDKIRQAQKKDCVRITGVPEDQDAGEFICKLAEKADIVVGSSEVSSYRVGKEKETIPGANPPAPRAAFVTFRVEFKKVIFCGIKEKSNRNSSRKKVSVFEDITKARRTLLATVRSKYKSGHTRTKQPNDLWSHDFSVEDITKCERAFTDTD